MLDGVRMGHAMWLGGLAGALWMMAILGWGRRDAALSALLAAHDGLMGERAGWAALCAFPLIAMGFALAPWQVAAAAPVALGLGCGLGVRLVDWRRHEPMAINAGWLLVLWATVATAAHLSPF